MLKRILLLLLLALVVIQFIHPAKNESPGEQPNRIASRYDVPPAVQEILAKACNDCHTNNTRYPWYAKIQPVDWWLTDHVNEGKKELNLDEYTNRSLRYQYHKLEEIAEQVKSGEMPLNSYTWMHGDAKLDDGEKQLITDWFMKAKDSLNAQH